MRRPFTEKAPDLAMPKFSLRVIAAVVAGLAVFLGLLRNPTPAVAAEVSAVLTVAMIAAGCMAIGALQPTRSFGIAFVATSIAVLWVNYGETPGRLGLSRPSLELAVWIDSHVDWSTSKGNVRALPADVRSAAPNPQSFQSIVVSLTALLGGFIGGWVAWASRRHAMRTSHARPPAGW